MVKSKEDVIAEFNGLVNMSQGELEEWLEDPASKKAGTGVGLESGHKIVGILKKNPNKDPEKYDEEDLEHMRKVVGYSKRHMKQEDHLKETKTVEELEKTKSTISLKNWGHDPIKTLDGHEDTAESNVAGSGEAVAGGGEAPQDGEDEDTREAADTSSRKSEDHSGSKRKVAADHKVEGTAAHSKVASEDGATPADETEEQEDISDRPRKKSKTNGDAEHEQEAAEQEEGHESDQD